MVQRVEATARTAADPQAVYELVSTGSTWPTWSPIGSFALESPGDGAPEGLGAVRVFRTGRTTSRERIVELVPGRRFSYALLSGLPIKGYRADIDLTPDGDGTRIRWHSTFTGKVPGTGWLYRLALGRFLQRCVDGLAAYATSRTNVSG